MPWIPLFAWFGAVAIAALVLGFCAYEIIGKARRLQRDVRLLQGAGDGLSQLQDHVAAAKQRLARVGAR